MKRFRYGLLVLCLGATLVGTAAADIVHRGINLSGGEFGKKKIPGQYGTDYIYPSSKDVDYFRRKGMNTFRIPFLWERLQPEPMAALDSAELARLDQLVSYITARGGTAILDVHNYARYHGEVLGKDVPAAALADLWRRLASIYKDKPAVFFGIMNEPHGMTSDAWVQIANQTISAIRAVATNRILVPGTAWSGAHSWTQSWYGVPNASALRNIVDPGNNFWVEAHQYLDQDSSGTKADCVTPEKAEERLAGFTAWLRETGNKGFMGEFAGARNAACNQALDAMLAHMRQHADVWKGWTYWSGGPWWGEYMFTLSPTKAGADRPQLAVLLKYLWARPTAPATPRVERIRRN